MQWIKTLGTTSLIFFIISFSPFSFPPPPLYFIYSLFFFFISLFLYFFQGHGRINHPLAAFSTPKFVFGQFLRNLHFCTGFWWSSVSIFCDPVAPYLKMQTLSMFWPSLAFPDIKELNDVEYIWLLCSVTTFTMSKLEDLRKLSRV